MRSYVLAFVASCVGMLPSSGAFVAPTTSLVWKGRPVPSRTIHTSSVSMELTHTLDGKVLEAPLQPVSNNILVKLFSVASRTTGGIVLPDQSQDVPTEGMVIGAGEGRTHPLTGKLIPMCVKPGDTVLFSKWSGRKVKYDGEEHMFIMDDDLLLVYRGAEVTESSLIMVRDQVLVKMDRIESETDSGIAISALAAEKDQKSQGRVVAIGEGRTTSTGGIATCPFEVGDWVKFREYALVEVKIEGDAYAVIRMVDCLSSWKQ